MGWKAGVVRRDLAADLGLKPLTARSLVLSALLGSHPPSLSARAIVALGSRFDLTEGTMRSALSRMTASGELDASGSRYTLGSRLRERQAAQDIALHANTDSWDGTWWFAIVETSGRALAERRAFRLRMEAHRMGELRPDTWLRPANIPGPDPTDDVLITRGELTGRDPRALASTLWDLPGIEATARNLTALAERALDRIATTHDDDLPHTFLVSITVVRFLRSEPQLPPDITRPDWPPDTLRGLYRQLQAAHTSLMTKFLAAADLATVHGGPQE